MFHTHYFKPSEKDPGILYCRCGVVKDLHRHIWNHEREIQRKRSDGQIIVTNGAVLKCGICGELKEFRISN